MKQFILPFAFFILICSCNNEDAGTSQQLRNENQILKNESAHKDSTIKKFVRSFNQIMINLDSIAATEKSITLIIKTKKKMKPDDKNKVSEQVKMITTLMEQNKSIADEMKVGFSSSKMNFTEFDSMLKNVQSQIDQKNAEINSLKQNLGDADVAYNTFDFTLEQLSNVNVAMDKKSKEQQALIEKLQQQANTVYYIIGSYKELKDAGVVAKTGLARVENTLKSFSTAKFLKADLRETKSIDVWSSNFRVISNHPVESHKADRNKLLISNPDEFWKLTKYLVILKD